MANFEEKLNVVNSVAALQALYQKQQTLIPTSTSQNIDWSSGSYVLLDLSQATGNVTLTLSGGQKGGQYKIIVSQGTTPRKILWPVNALYPSEQKGLVRDPIGPRTFQTYTLNFYNSNYFLTLDGKFNKFGISLGALAWGDNTMGTLGDGSNVSASSPVSVAGGYSFVSVAGGYTHSLGLLQDGTLLAWGSNASGALGTGNQTNSFSPVIAAGSKKFAKIAAANHSVGIDLAGTAWAWGGNEGGQLGNGSYTQSLSPVSVIGGHSFVDIACGLYFTVALKADGSAWSWGDNSSGQLGDNTTTTRLQPVSIVGGHSFVSIHCGQSHTIALKSNGDAFAWGVNSYGQLGVNSTSNKSSPTLVAGGYNFSKVAAGLYHTLFLDTSLACYSCGYGYWGQLGNGIFASASEPVLTPTAIGYNFSEIGAGNNHSLGVNSNGQVYSWGSNNEGQLGFPVYEVDPEGPGTENTVATPTLIPNTTGFTKLAPCPTSNWTLGIVQNIVN